VMLRDVAVVSFFVFVKYLRAWFLFFFKRYMLIYFFKRLLHGIPVLFVVSTITFVIMRVVPGGPFDQEKKLPPEILVNIQAKYHLDQPVTTQYLLYLKQLAQGDMGPSYKYIGRDVADIILDTFPVSIALGVMAMLVVIGVGIPMGVWSAYRQNSVIDRICMFYATLGISIPSFVLGTVLVWLMSHKLQWLPPALWEGPRYMILPAIALGAPFSGYISRLTRSAVLALLSSAYIRTPRAKWLISPVILF